ncbi:hypothetical protein [Phocicoccus pinnipedialis]|uniref:Uncharacterized protein n=1 Tax=Phocicoccus pinnipedialis TaxID=110845 RepID=A0A6V7R4Z3_9BACL|nr:hypothetical protein [Jeotgalicoccus pinnipedialis]MBP1940110.1 uncharacterized protein YneF (UPF0154 family) [Jeotgalicoccus pinnipedialis]CAD2071942.1 hypothetical protein JEOPIN946_00136 [Jeotgalicoccus pinnipedialis]
MKKNIPALIRVIDVLLFLVIFIGLFWVTNHILESNVFSRTVHTIVQIIGLSTALLFAMFISRFTATRLVKKYVAEDENLKTQYTYKHKKRK